MLLDELSGFPGHLIRRAHQICVSVFVEETSRFDLTPVQFAALTAIGSFPDIEASRLSQLVAFDRSTVGDVVERLETKGLLERTPSVRDKRAKHLRLTREGKRMLARVDPSVLRAQERMLGGLTGSERDVFLHLLRKMIDTHALDEDRAEAG